MTWLQRVLGYAKSVVDGIAPLVSWVPGVGQVAQAIQNDLDAIPGIPSYPITNPLVLDFEHVVQEGTAIYNNLVNEGSGYAEVANGFKIGGHDCIALIVSKDGTLYQTLT